MKIPEMRDFKIWVQFPALETVLDVFHRLDFPHEVSFWIAFIRQIKPKTGKNSDGHGNLFFGGQNRLNKLRLRFNNK